MLLIVHQCFLMMLSRKIIVRKATLQTTNKFFALIVTTKIELLIFRVVVAVWGRVVQLTLNRL